MGIQVVRRPSGDGEFWMLRVVAASKVIMILEQDLALAGYKH